MQLLFQRKKCLLLVVRSPKDITPGGWSQSVSTPTSKSATRIQVTKDIIPCEQFKQFHQDTWTWSCSCCANSAYVHMELLCQFSLFNLQSGKCDEQELAGHCGQGSKFSYINWWVAVSHNLALYSSPAELGNRRTTNDIDSAGGQSVHRVLHRVHTLSRR